MTDEAAFREDSSVAAAIMEDVCPSSLERREVLSQLLESISIADRLAPNSWAVSLFGDGFRLNVGPVEVFTFFGGLARLLLFASASASEFGEIVPIHYKSLPQPQSVFSGEGKDFVRARVVLRPAHTEFVRRASLNPSGKPAKSRFARSNSLGLFRYAQGFVET